MGNRITQTGPGGTTTYTYDANNRLLTAGSTTYSYDANGNLTSISTGQTFAWDVFNRLTQATGPGGTVSYTYNGDGLKTRRVGPDGTIQYYYDGIKPIWQTDAAGAMTAQLDRDIFGNLLSRREASGARRYYHFDGLGSTTALTNESGAATSTLLYDAWGNQRAATGSNQGRYRFTGAEWDQTTGLYHMGARFYDPAIGRWLSEDPVQDKYFEPNTLNFYTYAAGNPLVFVDPRGTQAEANRNAPQLTPDELRRLADMLGVPIGTALQLLGQGWEAFVAFAQKYEGVFTALGITAALGAAVLAIMAIGMPSLAFAATLVASVALVSTVATVIAQVSTGRLSAIQGVVVIGLSIAGLWGPAAVARAASSGVLTPGQAGLILGWFGARHGSMTSPFVQEAIVQHNRKRR